jgi:hypothetical protein
MFIGRKINMNSRPSCGIERAIGPDLGHRDLEWRQRHDQKVIHGAVLALAHNGGSRQDDCKHRHIVDDAHDAGEPRGGDVRIERNADIEIDRRQRRAFGV